MHLLRFFHDEADGYEVAIFAKSEQRADEIWRAIGGRFWLMPKGWLGAEHETWTLFGIARHEREACLRDTEGIGSYSPGRGWTILPLDYERVGIASPGP